MDFGRVSKELDQGAWFAEEIAGDRKRNGWLDSRFRHISTIRNYDWTRDFIICRPGSGYCCGYFLFGAKDGVYCGRCSYGGMTLHDSGRLAAGTPEEILKAIGSWIAA